MGTGETGTPMKAAKVVPTQDQQTAPNSYPEWAAAVQAYYNSGGQPPPGYFSPSVIPGPQPHSYMWGGQPMIPPYGPPAQSPYCAMYPHGGMYAHASIPPGAQTYGMPSPGGANGAAMMTPAGGDTDVMRASDTVKDRSRLKMSRGSLGSLGMLTSKGSDSEKGNSGSANGVFSQSGESGSDGSSEGSEDDNSQNMLQKRGFDQVPADGSGVAAGQHLSRTQVAISGKAPGVGGTTTNLGIGIQDHWSGSNPGAVPGGRGVKRTSASTLGGMDEREVKRQRRKQSNRESARRSRLRKQAECEELGTRVDTLTVENMALRTELARLSEDCKKLTADHSSLLDQLRKYQGEHTMAPKQGGDDKFEGIAMQSTIQPDSNVKMDNGYNISSPREQANGRKEDLSCNSPGKLPSALNDEPHPETLGAG